MKLAPVAPPEAGLPGARTAIAVTRQYHGKGLTDKAETSHYASSRAFAATPAQAERALELIRGHWRGVEILNHALRDNAYREDDTRVRHPRRAANIALLRNATLPLLRRSGRPDLPSRDRLLANRNNLPRLLSLLMRPGID